MHALDEPAPLENSSLFSCLQAQVFNEYTTVQQEIVRGMCHLSLTPKYHHAILSSGIMANIMPIAMTPSLDLTMRIQATQLFASVTATHPTTPAAQDFQDLLFLACNAEEDMEIRRYCVMTLSNAASDPVNNIHLLQPHAIEGRRKNIKVDKTVEIT